MGLYRQALVGSPSLYVHTCETSSRTEWMWDVSYYLVAAPLHGIAAWQRIYLVALAQSLLYYPWQRARAMPAKSAVCREKLFGR